MKIDPLAEAVLAQLARRPGSEEIVLGGYFALQQYLDYRTTHDIDAWWKLRPDPGAESAIRSAMEQIAQSNGLALAERRFGETLSFELRHENRKVFSFQIATRTVQLESPQLSAWPPILIETLTDNIGSKMNALVDRGSPRDLTDIYQLVNSGRTSIAVCWDLWQRKNPGEPLASAKGKVLFHLEALEQRRPLNMIVDEVQRQKAEAVRRWFRDEFARP